MTTTTGIHDPLALQAQATAAVKAKTVRLAYLDTLRVILISLVIALHTAITYGALGGWPYTDPNTSELGGILLTILNTLVQAFALGLYFFISAYFTPGSFDRKGIGNFWRDRMLRLGIPFVLYAWALNRIPIYIIATAVHDETRDFWTFFRQTALRDDNAGPTWFILALLIFCAFYTLWRLAARAIPAARLEQASRLKTPGIPAILLFGFIIGVLMFVVGLWFPVNATVEVLGGATFMVIFFVQYILFFIAGLLAYRNNWLSRFDGKDLRFWAWLSLALILCIPVMFLAGGAASGSGDDFLGGLHWQSVVFLLWVGFASVSFSMALILWLRDGRKSQSRLMVWAGPNTYGVYLLHPLVLIPISVYMGFVRMDSLMKFAIVLPLTLALTFLLSDMLRRIPGVKAIL